MRQAIGLFVLEFLLLVVFLPPFLLLPWGKSGLPPGPVVAVMAGLGLAVSLLARFRAGRAEGILEWRAAAMQLAIGPGLLVWAAGFAWRLGSGTLAGAALLGAALLSLLLWGFPPPPREPSAR